MDLRIQGGWICKIEVPATYDNNPFVGSVNFEKVKLPTSENKSILFQGSQQYRNLRVHFEKLQNGPMAGLMRAKELASERETDPAGVSWFFNWVYCIASGYGQKPGRALIWCLLFLAISILNLTLTDGVWVDPEAKRASQYGWAVGDPDEKVTNAFILTFQTAINPFTIFFTKAAFKFKSYVELFQTLFYVLLADGAFLFCVFAIRKRLKFS